jgi:hypothetical protein
MGAMTYGERLVSAAPLRQPVSASFQRPKPEVLNETIRVVFIGRNRDGFRVVRDAEAKFGGLFWRKQGCARFRQIKRRARRIRRRVSASTLRSRYGKPWQPADRAPRDRATPAVA